MPCDAGGTEGAPGMAWRAQRCTYACRTCRFSNRECAKLQLSSSMGVPLRAAWLAPWLFPAAVSPITVTVIMHCAGHS
jgi:hypothetical protein